MKLNNHIKRPASNKNVEINDEFWGRYIGLIKNVVIPYQWDVLNDYISGTEPSHAIKNFKIAAGLSKGEFYGQVFQDSDLAKWLEAVGFSLATNPDPELEKRADEIIDIIAKAQQDDGYLNTYFTIKEPDKKWTDLRDGHELYCAGHMIEAAVAYFEATGKRKLLDVVCRFADHIDSVFGKEPNKKKGYPGHEEIELALVKLYRVTGKKRYLYLSKYFIDERGRDPNYFKKESEARGEKADKIQDRLNLSYYQAHLPVRSQTKAEGHSVRAVYLYSGMADVAIETGDKTLIDACKKLWKNITLRRMYITGGIGSTSYGESFTFDCDLPNDTIYSETCASIGLFFFAYRMLQIDLNNIYSDIMEKVLYNSVISGIALDGKKFFYVNPLEVWPEASEKSKIKEHVKVTRQPWFSCACCPPNVARLLASISKYIYSTYDDEVYIHLYISSKAETEISGSRVKINQETQYPWNEEIKISISLEEEKEFSLLLRIPGWCEDAKMYINSSEIDVYNSKISGYIKLKRIWRNGDVIKLVLPMNIKRVKAHPCVRANMGKVAVQRGPVVYCLEEVDNGSNLHEIVLSNKSKLKAEFDDNLLGGIMTISAEAERYDPPWSEELYRADIKSKYRSVNIKFIPYYAWANRTPGEMIVWVNEK
jgi:DUF1680 family protein